MKYTPKSELFVELNNSKKVNCYNGRIFSLDLYISDGKLFKKLVCKSVTCQAHNNRYRELKLQKINKSVLKNGKITPYEYKYYNVKDIEGKIVAISPSKLYLLTYAATTPQVTVPEEPTLEDILTTPD
jgi:hypothetical protein